jgi:phosphatidylglycerophosphatase A
LLGTWFGVGFLPIMPGTWGSLAALPCAWAIRSMWGLAAFAVAFVIVFAAGCWAAAKLASASTSKDPGAVVIDEVAGQWLVLLAVPLDPGSYSLGFLLFRIFDIWKPWPVRCVERRVPGGLGIMLDDLVAAVYAVVGLSVLLRIGGAYGVRS